MYQRFAVSTETDIVMVASMAGGYNSSQRLRLANRLRMCYLTLPGSSRWAMILRWFRRKPSADSGMEVPQAVFCWGYGADKKSEAESLVVCKLVRSDGEILQDEMFVSLVRKRRVSKPMGGKSIVPSLSAHRDRLGFDSRPDRTMDGSSCTPSVLPKGE